MLFTHLDLDPGEKIIHEVRKHWYVFIWQFVSSLVLILLPPILYLVGLAFLPQGYIQKITNYFFLTLFFYSLWFILIWIVLFVKWTNYYLDVWYITDRRIIDVNQKGIFHREVSNLRFDKIQDITVEVNGVIATFFKFGDLRVQTASEDSKDFMMKSAAHPELVRKIVFETHNSQSSQSSQQSSPATSAIEEI